MADQGKRVGYKNPPTAYRYQPGQSGNPSGRPKGSTNAKTAWRKCLNTPVQVTIGGKKTTMTTLDAMIRRMVQLSLSGDFKALQYTLSQAGFVDTEPNEGLDPAVEAQRRQLVEEVLNSLRGNNNEPASGK